MLGIKAISIGLRAKSATEAQLNSINKTAWERLQAIQRGSQDSDWGYRDGSIMFLDDGALYLTGFKNKIDWLRLLDKVHEWPIDADDLASPAAAPNRYKRDGWRFWYPPTCNVKYRVGHHSNARVIDLGAISA